MNKIEIKTRTFHPFGNEHKPHETSDEVYINDEPVPMGEGVASIYEAKCKIHGRTHFIYGSNQGGHDGVDVCLKCCAEIQEHLDPSLVEGPLEGAKK